MESGQLEKGDTDHKAAIYKFCDELRGLGEELSLSTLARYLDRLPFPLTDQSLRQFTALALNQKSGGIVEPISISSFTNELARAVGPSNGAILHAGLGCMARALSRVRSVSQLEAVERQADICKIVQHVGGGERVNWYQANPQAWLESQTQQFDLLLALSPFSVEIEEYSFAADNEQIVVRDQPAQLLILRAGRLLSESGVGVFVVPPKFAFDDRRQSVRRVMSAAGLHLNALIHVPSGSFAPVTQIPAYLAIVSRRPTEKLFVAELSDNQDRNKAIVKLLCASSESKDPAMGRLVIERDFSGWQSFRQSLELHSYFESRARSSFPLGSLVREVNLAAVGKNFEEQSDAVYLPAIGESAVAGSLSSLHMKHQNYLQLVVDTSKVERRFLVSYLNSELGLLARRVVSKGTTIPRITRSSVVDLLVSLPPLPQQLAVVDAETKISNLLSRLIELKSKLLSDPDAVKEVSLSLDNLDKKENFESWLDQLPFPLATILWHYHVRNEAPKEKYEQLIHFFEATVEFLATLMISGFRRQPTLYAAVCEEFKSFLKEGSFERTSFGTWLIVTENLSAKGRSALKSWKDETVPVELAGFPTDQRQFFEMLFSEQLLSTLRQANKFRNAWKGHSGAVNDNDARHRLTELEALLAEVRREIGVRWAGLEVVRPRTLRFVDGAFNQSVERLIGVRTPFIVEEVQTAHPLDENKLYLFDKRSGKAIEIAPFIKVLASPQSAQNTCYFYNKTDAEGVKFISYYHSTDSEVVDAFPDTREFLKELVG
jgi:hypothetical protein